jgi:predicted DNA-binding transcriptional regulator AlpA
MPEDLTPQTDWLRPQQIISEKEAARLRGVSIDTFRRLVERGEGPERLKLSTRRIGYRLADCLRFGGK